MIPLHDEMMERIALIRADRVGDGEGDGKGLARDKFEIWKLRSWPPEVMADLIEAQGRDAECWEQQKRPTPVIRVITASCIGGA